MRLGPQADRARGTHDRPYSALNLRLLLAGFGMVCTLALTVGLWLGGWLEFAAAAASSSRRPISC